MTFKEFIEAAEAFFGKAVHEMEVVLPFVHEAADATAVVSTAVGHPEIAAVAGIVGTIANGTETALKAHDDAGNTPESAVATAVKIAQSVAASGAVDQATADKINSVAGTVSSLTPELAAALTAA